MSENRPALIAAWLFIAAIIVSCAIMGHIIWPQAEDINAYGCNPELLSPLGIDPPPFSELTANAVDSYLHDNGRFVNYTDILLTALTPRWSWPLLNILFLASLYWLLWRISTIASKRRGAVMVALMGVLSLLFIPWNDYLFLQRYTTPYIWGGAMMLFVAYGAIRAATGNAFSPLMTAILCPVAFISGGWHEGFSLTLACGLIPLWFLTPRDTRKRALLPALFLLAGIILNITAPGQSARADSAGVHLNPFNWFQPASLTGGIWPWPHIVPMALYLASLAATLLVERRQAIARLRLIADGGLRQAMHRLPGLPDFVKLQTLSATVTAATLGLCLFFNPPRVAVPGLLFSIIGILSLAIRYYPSTARKTLRTASAIAVTACAALLLTQAWLNIAMQARLSRDHRAIETLLAESPDGEVFYDPAPWPHRSHYPWQWTMNHYYVDYVTLHFILVHPSNRRHIPLRLIPTILKDIPGSVRVSGITLHEGHLISDTEPRYTSADDTTAPRTEIFPGEYPYLKFNAVVTTASGKEETRFFEAIPFTTSEATPDRRDLYYLRPVWLSHSDISDPAVSVISVSPAKYW